MASTRDRKMPKVFNHYRVVREIGRGGMGVVFEGRDRRDNSRVAIKVLHQHLTDLDPGYRERFEREAHVAALLRSPYAVHLLDFGCVDQWYFIAMEFVEGESLADILEKGRIDPDAALRFSGNVARALEEAEARGVVHRDIKPANILVDSTNGLAKLTDFGIARRSADSGVTAPGTFVGTAAYAAPEQFGGIVDNRSDIYALGATLYTMLAGHPPFDASTISELLRAHREAPIPMGPLAGLPDPVVNVTRRGLEKDPRDRYQTAGEMAGALDRARQALLGTSGWRPAAMPPAAAPSVPSPSQTTSEPGPTFLQPSSGGAPSVPPTLVPSTTVEPSSAGAPPVTPTLVPSTTVEPSSAGAPPVTQTLVPSTATGPATTSSGQVNLRLRQRTTSSGLRGTTTYELVLENGSTGFAPTFLEATDPSGRSVITAPKWTTVPPGAAQVVELSVAPRRRRWHGGREKRTFVVSARGEGGSEPPATITGEYEDLPFGRLLPAGAALGIALVLVVAAVGAKVTGLVGGGGGTAQSDAVATTIAGPSPTAVPSSPTASSSSTVAAATTTAATAAPSTVPTSAPAIVVATPVPATPRPAAPTATPVPPTATPVPPTPTPAPKYIEDGIWSYNFIVQSNNCTASPAPGQSYNVSIRFVDNDRTDGYIFAGDTVTLYEVDSSEVWLGNYTFTYPRFQASWPIGTTTPGRETLVMNFVSPITTIGPGGGDTLTDTYNVSGGTCSIVATI